MSMTSLDYALAYAAAGLSVIPVGPDKRPVAYLLPRDPNGKPTWKPFQTAIADTATITRWFTATTDIATVTGNVSGGLIGIDFDSERLYHAWRNAVGALAGALVIQRTGDGYHALCRCQAPGASRHLAYFEDEASWTGREIGIETRGEAAYLMLAPSTHAKTGRRYTVIQGALTDIPIIIQNEVEQLLAAARELDECPFTRQQIEAHAMTMSRPRTGNNVIEAYNDSVSIEEILTAHGYRIQDSRGTRPGGTHASITIKSNRSFHHSTNDPLDDGYWHTAFDVFCKLDHGNDAKQAVKAAAQTFSMTIEPGDRLPSVPLGEYISARPTKPTDDELCDQWLATAPQTAFGLGEFRRYANGKWDKVEMDVIRAEVLDILCQEKGKGIRPTNHLASSVLELGRIRCSVPASRWDRDPDILVCTNGTLKISTGELLPHSSEHYVTSGLDYSYEPGAAAPAWKKSLEALDPGVVQFLQEFSGYALTVDVSYEIAVWLYGAPGGGKSTFLEGLRAMLGPRVCTLGLAALDRSSFGLANIPGKTLALSTEQPADFVRSTHLLNALISGETVTVEKKYKDPFDIEPRIKLVWAMNDLPRLSAGGNGISRRVKVVTFPPIPESSRDPRVKERVKEEGQGILNWSLEGLRRLQERGRFLVPNSVTTATNEFCIANDIPAQFILEDCVTWPEQKTQSSVLYSRYKWWCDTNGHRAQSSTSLAPELKRLGLTKRGSNGRQFWHGVGLRPVRPGE